MCAVLAIAIGVGASGGPSAQEALALRFARQWAHGSYAAMYGELSAPSRRSLSGARFATDLAQARATATVASAGVHGHARALASGRFAVPLRVRTRIFGSVRASLDVVVREGSSGPRVTFDPVLLFPGLRPGERLHRETALPPRAALLARDGTALAEGSPAPGTSAGPRGSSLGAAATAVAGEVGPVPANERSALEAEGVPANATVGTSGLEAAFDARLRGRPGGTLLEGARVVARSSAQAAPPLRTTIAPAIQRAAVVALGGRLGGIVALRPHTGEVLAVAGLGIDDLQPPGSTFKMVTVSAVLQAGVARTTSTFPDATAATLDGVTLRNAGGESCGGSLAEAFATSCNSVFAPLGVKVGAARLVAMAERFGFNQGPGLPGAVESTLPSAAHIDGELALGSTAIGQGEVLASPLQMALVAATIGNRGVRPRPTFLPLPPPARATAAPAGPGANVRTSARSLAGQGAGAHATGGEGTSAGGAAGAGRETPPGTPVLSAALAHTVTGLMLDVVRSGTGTSAAISGLEVAGKTGTAELGGGSGCPEGSSPETGGASAEGCAEAERRSTDAWFAAFAPAGRPQIALATMLVRDGFGGDTAAPVAREVIEAWRDTAGR